MILDTTYFLDLKRQDPAAFEKGLELCESAVPHSSTDTRLLRAHVQCRGDTGRGGAADGRERPDGLPPASADERIGRLAGRLEAETRTEGESSGADIGDAYVAATARLHDEPVLTRNVEDFEALGAEVETY